MTQRFAAHVADGVDGVVAPVPAVAIDSGNFEIVVTADTVVPNGLLASAVARYTRLVFKGNPTRSDRSHAAALASGAAPHGNSGGGACTQLAVTVAVTSAE